MTPVFIHINKTAGSSVVRAAGDRIVDAGHRTASMWVAQHGRPTSMFSVVRHPYDRVRSEYNYRRRRYLAGEDNPHLANLHLDVDEWVEATFERDEFRTQEFFERSGVPFNSANAVDGVLIWFLPQFVWLTDSTGSILPDDVLRFERLADEWLTWSRVHGIEGGLPHVNRSSDTPGAAGRLGRRAREIVARHHRADFEVFGYPT